MGWAGYQRDAQPGRDDFELGNFSRWNGTLISGAGWAAGVSNNAVNLNGSSQYVSLPAGAVSGLSNFSITAWVKLNSVGTWSRNVEGRTLTFDVRAGEATQVRLRIP